MPNHEYIHRRDVVPLEQSHMHLDIARISQQAVLSVSLDLIQRRTLRGLDGRKPSLEAINCASDIDSPALLGELGQERRRSLAILDVQYETIGDAKQAICRADLLT